MKFVWEKIQVENGEPSEKIVIIAKNFNYFLEWCRIYGINLGSHMVTFASKPNDLVGFKGVWYVHLGTDDMGLQAEFELLRAMDAIKPLLEPNV